jgi:hypothetical protein
MHCTIDVTRAESDDSRDASFVMVSIVATAFLPFASILRVNVPESFAAKRSRQVARKPSLFERAICRQRMSSLMKSKSVQALRTSLDVANLYRKREDRVERFEDPIFVRNEFPSKFSNSSGHVWLDGQRRAMTLLLIVVHFD